MSLEQLYHSLSKEEQIFQFGTETGDPLAKAFPRKRVVHAGLNGEVIGPDESQKIWEEIMAVSPVSKKIQMAYIHIPFCKTKCLYCGFFQNGTNQDVEDHYIDCLIKELEASAQKPRLKDGLIHALFIGGGTPTSLSAHNAERLLQTIQRCLPLANDYELTLEGRIHDLVPEKMDVWLANGVNRMSLGVQSFHTQIRQQVGRLDDQETVLRNLTALKAYEQCAVVIDLIYGLPGQNMNIWKEDLELLVQSGVDGADLYQLNVFDGSELNKQIQSGKLPPAAESEYQARMFSFAKDFLDKRAYRRLNICHWSCSNRERSLYNTLARSGAVMFPFGSGAGGNVDGYSTMLHRALQPYEMFVQAGKKPFMALMRQSPLQPIVDCIQDQLEQGYLDVAKVVAFNDKLCDLTWLYDLWEKRGLVKNNGVMYVLTDAGQFWQVNLTQTTLECVQYLMTGKTGIAVERVAAQDSAKTDTMIQAMKKMKDMKGAHGVEAMKQMAEAMQNMSPEELQAVMKRMQGSV
ncbi:MAG: heme anaerobic degradation radical SAM methyltransferase ChuW/HutW [Megasphaera cerevisiae]|jgi:oxygen-independent coproporphyrinogen-3 oxidase|nr:heme anaerobic degradation radical SAM methyltransferase ChuW/HutW [Megasphaera cerevisiae]